MPSTSPARARIHYAWWVAGAGLLTMFACLGLGRFAFGVLLPPMAEALELDYAQRGFLGTANFVGYLGMVALCPLVARRLGHRLTVALGLGAIALSMALVGLAGSYAWAMALYTLTGMGSGAANISMMSLVARWFAPGVRGSAAGLIIAGNGLGIVVSGFVAPWLTGLGGWRLAWLALAGLVALCAATAWLVLRNDPADRGLAMLGGRKGEAPQHPAAPMPSLRSEMRLLVHLGCIYAIFGMTYLVYATFFVTTLVDGLGLGQGAAGRFWSWVGFFSLFSGPLFGRLSDATSRRVGLMAVFALQTAAYGLAAFGGGLWQGMGPVYASVVLFGITAWAAPTIMAATVADRLGPGRVAAGFSLITFFLAVGQVLGPAGAGLVAEWTGGFAAAFAACAGLTLGGVVLSFFLGVARPKITPLI